MAQGPGEVGHGSSPADDTTTSTATPAPTSDEIRSQIEHTRAEMSDTIDAIQARLSPSRLLTQAKESVKEATVGRVRNLALRSPSAGGFSPARSARFLQTVRDNPMPATVLGVIAIGVLGRVLADRRSARPVSRHHRKVQTTGRHQSTPHRRTNRQFFAAAAAGAACWAIWKKQASGSSADVSHVMAVERRAGGL
jgi:hypothetical protein